MFVCLCRLIVSAKPLNITYNLAAIRQVMDCFSFKKSDCRSYDIESHLACECCRSHMLYFICH